MHRTLLMLLPLLVFPGCLSKGDTVVESDRGTTRQGGTLCAQFCEKLEDECSLTLANCEANCRDSAVDCEASSDLFLECFLANPLSCGVGLESTRAATCDDEGVAVEECKALRDGVSACAGECPDGVCVELDGEEGFLCSDYCTEDSECVSGCCGLLESGNSACALPEFCAPVGVGSPCVQDTDCAADAFCDTVNYFCTKGCQQDSECGESFLGFPNVCVNFDPDDPVNGLCTPTCNDEADCAPHYELIEGCVAAEDYNYCY